MIKGIYGSTVILMFYKVKSLKYQNIFIGIIFA